MKVLQIIIVLMLVSIGVMAQLPGGESVILAGLNKQLADNVNPIVFTPFGTVVTADIMKDQLDKYFPYIKIVVNGVNEKLPNYVVLIAGYANPPGDKDTVDAKNTAKRLSLARAKAVRNYLLAKGLKEAALRTTGYGDADRVTASFNDGAEAWGKNRRVILKIVKKSDL